MQTVTLAGAEATPSPPTAEAKVCPPGSPWPCCPPEAYACPAEGECTSCDPYVLTFTTGTAAADVAGNGIVATDGLGDPLPAPGISAAFVTNAPDKLKFTYTLVAPIRDAFHALNYKCISDADAAAAAAPVPAPVPLSGTSCMVGTFDCRQPTCSEPVKTKCPAKHTSCLSVTTETFMADYLPGDDETVRSKYTLPRKTTVFSCLDPDSEEAAEYPADDNRCRQTLDDQRPAGPRLDVVKCGCKCQTTDSYGEPADNCNTQECDNPTYSGAAKTAGGAVAAAMAVFAAVFLN